MQASCLTWWSKRRRLLDAADLLLTVGGRSSDRKRYRTGERPRRKGFWPYRNRAMELGQVLDER